jgi:hypothetical protein
MYFLCPFAAKIWCDSGVWNYVEAAVNSSNNVAETIFLLLQNLEEQKSVWLAVVMWSI